MTVISPADRNARFYTIIMEDQTDDEKFIQELNRKNAQLIMHMEKISEDCASSWNVEMTALVSCEKDEEWLKMLVQEFQIISAKIIITASDLANEHRTKVAILMNRHTRTSGGSFVKRFLRQIQTPVRLENLIMERANMRKLGREKFFTDKEAADLRSLTVHENHMKEITDMLTRIFERAIR